MDFVITRTSDSDKLMHYGVPGMKWGHRKAQLPISSTSRRVDSTKAAYKSAKKAYSKSYDNAYSYSARHLLGQYTNKKKKAESHKRWSDVYDKANAVDKAKSDYKNAKAQRKDELNKTYSNIQKNASFREKLTYNNATRKKAAKYVVDNGMSIKDAKAKANKDAIRNTAVMLAAYGGITAAALYKMNH